MTYHLSLLDKSPIESGRTAAQALQLTAQLAGRAEQLGYHRFWVAEHHNIDGLASSAPGSADRLPPCKNIENPYRLRRRHAAALQRLQGGRNISICLLRLPPAASISVLARRRAVFPLPPGHCSRRWIRLAGAISPISLPTSILTWRQNPIPIGRGPHRSRLWHPTASCSEHRSTALNWRRDKAGRWFLPVI
jgi:hypothetical protein